MRTRSIIICTELGLLLTTCGARPAAGPPAAGPATPPPKISAPDTAPGVSAAKPKVEVSLRVGDNWRRVELNTDTPLFLECSGEVEGTVQFELSIDGRVATTTTASATRSRLMFADLAFPDKRSPATARRVSFWNAKTAGKHELTLKVTTATKDVFTCGPVTVEAAQLQRPALRFLEQPPVHLLTTEPFNVVLAATTSEGKETQITLVRGELKEVITTNGPTLSLRGRKLPPGIHQFEAGAADDRGLSSKPLSFTCIVDAVERPGTLAPASLIVETATLPGQARPRAWRPDLLSGGQGRIAGAADALQLYWQTPTNGVQTAGTLIQRLDPGAKTWKTVVIVQKDVGEWRDHGLSEAHYYKYRIAFMCDDTSRTPFSPEQGESTCLWTPSYGIIQIPSERQ